MSTTSALLRGPAVLLVALLSVFAVLLSGFHTPARADTNADISVTVTEFKAVNSQGQTNDGALVLWSLAKLSFTWDASGTTVQPGDSFYLNFGEYFNARVPGVSSNLTVDASAVGAGQDAVIGSCTVEKKLFTCTFNDNVKTLRDQGFSQFHGKGSIVIQAVKETTEKTVDMILNDKTVAVPLPGDSPIGVGPTSPWNPAKFGKWASSLAETSTTVNWTIAFNPKDLNEKRKAAGLPELPVDGTTVSTLVFDDVIGTNQKFESPVTMSLYYREEGAASNTKAATTSGSLVADHSISAVLSANDTAAKITVQAPLVENRNYYIYFRTTILDDAGNPSTAVPGKIYENSVTYADTNTTVTAKRYYSQSFTIDAWMTPGFGGFKMIKEITGDGSSMIPAGTTFPVTVDYTLPGGAIAETYVGWSAPGTLNDTRTGGTFTFEAKSGHEVIWDKNLPKGTVVTLSEDLGSAPHTDVLDWGTPVFVVDGIESNTFTVADQTAAAITLKNTANVKKGSFAVLKTTTGDNGKAADKEFSFTYVCTADANSTDEVASGELKVKAGAGAVDAGLSLPVGTVCVITEVADSAAIGGLQVNVPNPVTVTIDKDTVVTASFENTYTTPPPGTKPKTPKGLSTTGTEAIVMGGIAAVLVAAGTTLLVLRRRSRD